MNRILTILTLTAALSACNETGHFGPGLPVDRTATPEELQEQPLQVTLGYALGTPAPWDRWVGTLDVELHAPSADRVTPLATASVGAGLEGTCLGSSLEGFWDYDEETGRLVVDLTGTGGTVILEGTTNVDFTRADPDDTRSGNPEVRGDVSVTGIWTVALLGDCAGNFAGGQDGTFEARQAEPIGSGEEEMSVEVPVGLVLVFDESTGRLVEQTELKVVRR